MIEIEINLLIGGNNFIVHVAPFNQLTAYKINISITSNRNSIRLKHQQTKQYNVRKIDTRVI